MNIDKARNIWNYALGRTNKIVNLDDSRAILLYAANRTLIDNSLTHEAVREYFDRMAAPIAKHYNVIATLFNPDVVMDRNSRGHATFRPDDIKNRTVVIWQHNTEDVEKLLDAAKDVSRLIGYIGMSRYEPESDVKFVKNNSNTDESSMTYSTEISAGGSTNLASVKGAVRDDRKYSDAQSVSREETVQMHKWSPSTILLDVIQQKLDLPTCKYLNYVSSPEFINAGLSNGKVWSEYRKLSVGESTLLALAGKLLDNMKPADVDISKDISSLKFALENGYTVDALESVNRLYGAKSPPEDGDWLFHIVLYAAMFRGARMGIDASLDNPNKVIPKEYISNRYVSEVYGDIVPKREIDEYFAQFPGSIFKKDGVYTVVGDILPTGDLPLTLKNAIYRYERKPHEPINYTPNCRVSNILRPEDMDDKLMSNGGYDPVNISYGNFAKELNRIGLTSSAKDLCLEHARRVALAPYGDASLEIRQFSTIMCDESNGAHNKATIAEITDRMMSKVGSTSNKHCIGPLPSIPQVVKQCKDGDILTLK